MHATEGIDSIPHFVSSCSNVFWSMSLTLPHSALLHRLHSQPHTYWSGTKQTTSATLRGLLLFWRFGRIQRSLRLWAQFLGRSQQWAHSEPPPDKWARLLHQEWPCRHSRSLRELWRFSEASGSQHQPALCWTRIGKPLRWPTKCGNPLSKRRRVQASGNRCVVMSQFRVWKECCREENGIEI